jgi:hypothetical protein
MALMTTLISLDKGILAQILLKLYLNLGNRHVSPISSLWYLNHPRRPAMNLSRKMIPLPTALICLFSTLMLLTDVPASGQSLSPDVGLITQLSGDVVYWNEGYQMKPAKAKAFMKIRQGDHIKLTGGAMVRLIYFRNGLQETWKGPAALMVGEERSQTEGKKETRVQPEVIVLPAGATKGVRNVPPLLRRAGIIGSSGMLVVRGDVEFSTKNSTLRAEGRAEIEAAKEICESLQNPSMANDITLELNLLGVLAKYGQFEEMEEVVKKALEKQPDNEVLTKLQEWVRTQH